MTRKITLTKQDLCILESYKTTVHALAAYLGDAYEIILHSLADPEHSVIEIANGFHTGRTVGAPITDLAVSWLEKMESNEETVDQYCYYSKNKQGEPLKSSTIAIRGSQNRIIGLLCINLYLGTPFIDLVSNLVPKQSSIFAAENFATNPDAVGMELKKASEQVLANRTIPPLQQKKEIIRILYHRNIFDIKNAVEQVAEGLEISSNTVYFHLRNIVKGK